MSTFSLPRLLNGGGSSKNSTVNKKFATLNGRSSCPARQQQLNRRQRLDESEFIERRKAITRKGSIAHNQFRGIKREHLERHTTQIVHSLTVGPAIEQAEMTAFVYSIR